MQFFTEESFNKIPQSLISEINVITPNSPQFNNKDSNLPTLYLSYAILDKKLVIKTATFLKSVYQNIHIDWAEYSMSEKNCIDNATNIKNKIITNNKFILIATSASIFSRWVNWELGIADSNKYSTDNLAIFPIVDPKSNWHGNDYLNIYPRIEQHTKSSINSCNLVYPDGTVKSLQDWLES